MITLIYGHTGSGKTFLSVKMLHKAWKKGFNIYTNHPLNFGSDEGIMRWHNLEELFHLKNGIIFIDDAIKLLDAQRWQQLPTSFKEKIAGHRHDHIDIITNIQDFYQINVDVRRNVHRLIGIESVFRSSRNDRIQPILQVSRAVEKVRRTDVLNEKSQWTNRGRAKLYFISRLWTKSLYDTYDNIYLDRFICSIKHEKKWTAAKNSKGEWRAKIYSRDLVNQGKARI